MKVKCFQFAVHKISALGEAKVKMEWKKTLAGTKIIFFQFWLVGVAIQASNPSIICHLFNRQIGSY